jgi:hypothetical protein
VPAVPRSSGLRRFLRRRRIPTARDSSSGPNPAAIARAEPSAAAEPGLDGELRQPEAALPVPGWVAAPVLKLAIPDSPFGAGGGDSGMIPEIIPETLGFDPATEPKPSVPPFTADAVRDAIGKVAAALSATAAEYKKAQDEREARAEAARDSASVLAAMAEIIDEPRLKKLPVPAAPFSGAAVAQAIADVAKALGAAAASHRAAEAEREARAAAIRDSAAALAAMAETEPESPPTEPDAMLRPGLEAPSETAPPSDAAPPPGFDARPETPPLSDATPPPGSETPSETAPPSDAATPSGRLADRLGRLAAARIPGPVDAAGNAVSPPRRSVYPARPVLAHRPAPAAASTSGAAVPARQRPRLAPASARTRSAASGPVSTPVPEGRSLAQNRRLYRRVMLTAQLEVDGVSCRLLDLSIGGFAASEMPRRPDNEALRVTLRMNIDGIDIGTVFTARMVHRSEARTAARFVELTAAQTAFLRYIVTWRGESAGAIGTTTLLDAITRWPERAFQPQPTALPPPAPSGGGWWSRWFARIPVLGRRRRE